MICRTPISALSSCWRIRMATSPLSGSSICTTRWRIWSLRPVPWISLSKISFARSAIGPLCLLAESLIFAFTSECFLFSNVRKMKSHWLVWRFGWIRASGSHLGMRTGFWFGEGKRWRNGVLFDAEFQFPNFLCAPKIWPLKNGWKEG